MKYSCSDCDFTGSWKGLASHTSQSDCENDFQKLAIEEFRKVAEKIEKVPTRKEFDKNSSISKNSAINKFESYNDLVKSSGFIPNREVFIKKQEIIKEVKRVNKKYNGITRELMRKRGRYSPSVCEERFGSWNNTLKTSNIEINNEGSIEYKEFIKEIERLKEELGHVPSGKEMDKHGKYSSKSYNENFSTYNNAVEEAGFEPKYEQYASGKNSHAYGITGEEHPRYGKPPKSSNWHYNEITGNRTRSSWEAEFDELLYKSLLDYGYEEERFEFENFSYLPDFFVEDCFIVEIKGYCYGNSKEKGEFIVEQLNSKEYIVIGGENTKDIKSDVWFHWDDREKAIEYMKSVV